MSHKRILDKIRPHFVNLLPDLLQVGKACPKGHDGERLHNEDRQKSYFNGKAFEDVPAEMIA
jgi:hypothetical protein